MASCSEICGPQYAEQTNRMEWGHPSHYGVRSYLHYFYEECTTSVPEQNEDVHPERSPKRLSSGLWKVFLAFGAVVLTVGLTLLTVSFATPLRIEAFGEEDLLFVDQRAVHFNNALEVCKLAGAFTFCAGGGAMAVGLLLSAFLEEEKSGGISVAAPGKRSVPLGRVKVQNVQPKPAS